MEQFTYEGICRELSLYDKCPYEDCPYLYVIAENSVEAHLDAEHKDVTKYIRCSFDGCPKLFSSEDVHRLRKHDLNEHRINVFNPRFSDRDTYARLVYVTPETFVDEWHNNGSCEIPGPNDPMPEDFRIVVENYRAKLPFTELDAQIDKILEEDRIKAEAESAKSESESKET